MESVYTADSKSAALGLAGSSPARATNIHKMEYFAKNRLRNNISYFGIHEDTAVAKWDSRKECFWYISAVYCQAVMVSLKHPADGGSFKPVAELLGHGDVNTTLNGLG